MNTLPIQTGKHVMKDMNGKPYKLGIFVGRFQVFHSGHEMMLSKGMELCEQVGIFVGSSQESGTLKNPFSYEMREEMLTKVLGGENVSIYPLPDIWIGNNSKWGEYVLENVMGHFGMTPDLFISGKEERRISWFDSVAGLAIAELYIPKSIDISATEMRRYMIDGDFETWKKYVNPVLWEDFDRMRDVVISSKDNLETGSI